MTIKAGIYVHSLNFVILNESVQFHLQTHAPLAHSVTLRLQAAIFSGPWHKRKRRPIVPVHQVLYNTIRLDMCDKLCFSPAMPRPRLLSSSFTCRCRLFSLPTTSSSVSIFSPQEENNQSLVLLSPFAQLTTCYGTFYFFHLFFSLVMVILNGHRQVILSELINLPSVEIEDLICNVVVDNPRNNLLHCGGT